MGPLYYGQSKVGCASDTLSFGEADGLGALRLFVSRLF